MSLESNIQLMPKVDLHVRLEGTVDRQALVLIAEQNDAHEMKHFNTWANLLSEPDYDRLDDVIKMSQSWLRVAEDLTRLAYAAGTHLAKQNVRYAEVTFNPGLYHEMNLTLDNMVAALNDGRDRAQRAWGIELAWVLAIPREEPRRAEDYVRWASTAAARKAGVVGVGLVGKETAQPVGQFERAFASAEKKGVLRVPRAGESLGADGVLKVIQALSPTRVVDGWGVADSPEALKALADGNIGLDVAIGRAVAMKKVKTICDYPLRQLYDANVMVTIGSDLPLLYKISLNDIYLELVKSCGFSLDELQDIALNAVRASQLADDAREAILAEFTEQYAELRKSEAN